MGWRWQEGTKPVRGDIRNQTTWKDRAGHLIDEYDTPILSGYQYGYLDEVSLFFRNLLSGALKDNRHLFKGVLTGVLRSAREIFSPV